MCRSSFAQNRKKYFCHACQKHFANFFNQIFDETKNWKSFSIKNLWNWRLNLGKEMFLFDPKKVKQEYVFDDFWFLNLYFFQVEKFPPKILKLLSYVISEKVTENANHQISGTKKLFWRKSRGEKYFCNKTSLLWIDLLNKTKADLGWYFSIHKN